MTLADRAVLGKRAPRLAHVPDRGALHGLSTRGADEERGDHDVEGSPRLWHSAGIAPLHSGAVEPLVPLWRESTLAPPRAGARTTARLVLENGGAATWRSRGDEGLQLSYHWLDTHGNAIVWDGKRTAFPRPVAPGETVAVDLTVDAPRPPGRYVLRFDLVEEHRFWLSEVGVATQDVEVDVAPLISARRLAVVVHGGPDPRTEAALAAQEEPVVADEPAGDGPPRRGGRAGARLVARCCSTPMPRAGPRSAPRWFRSEGRSNAAARSGRCERGPRRAATRGSTPRSCSPRSSTASCPASAAASPPTSGEGLFEGRAVVRLPTRSGRRPT